MTVTALGIRHHGPGCARSLPAALRELAPDLVLVEGPPEADPLIPVALDAGLVPPVALMTWVVAEPQRAVFHPFAVFSPEWQALRWALTNGVPVRFCDLPMTQALALPRDDGADDAGEARDPLHWLAVADGYADGEQWWNDRIEETGSDARLFAEIGAAVGAVREELALAETTRSQLREASMRQQVRAAQREGFARIAFVCGAWHVPALGASTATATADAALLKGLARVKVGVSWTPWTHGRLTRASGYGAGVRAPGWYEHLFTSDGDTVPRWLVRAARELRSHDLPTSSANVIDATRLATTLASLRGRPVAGLAELDAAIRAVFCGGEDALRPLLERTLLVGERLGELPPGLARLPLEADLLAIAKSLRLVQGAAATVVEVDLREENGRRRSVFLHRLLALDVPWGRKQDAGRTRGSFKEVWKLQWQPELAIALVDAAAFGNTIESAAAARLARDATATASVAELVPRLGLAMLADLPAALPALRTALQERAARTDDVGALLDAVPPLVHLARYGDVRATDQELVRGLLPDLVARVHVGLGAAAVGIDAEAAQELAERVRAHHAALAVLADDRLLAGADAALLGLADRDDAHAQVRGLAVRLLRGRHVLDEDAAARRLQRELSQGAAPARAAAWLEGFLGGHGADLAHDPGLLATVDAWVAALSDERFQEVLPLVRRTFGTFAAPERRQVATALRSRWDGAKAGPAAVAATSIDRERARPAVAALARLFGLPEPGAALDEGAP